MVLDARVVFRNGGKCANQGISQLTVSNNDSDVIYTCSNEVGFEGPCNSDSNSRFRVVSGPDCTSDCKYYVDLILLNFADSDVGNYTVEVLFKRVSDTEERNISRTFSLDIAPVGMW